MTDKINRNLEPQSKEEPLSSEAIAEHVAKEARSSSSWGIPVIIIFCLILVVVLAEWIFHPRLGNPFLDKIKTQNSFEYVQLEKKVDQLNKIQLLQQNIISKNRADIAILLKQNREIQENSNVLLTQVHLIGQSLQLAQWYLLAHYKVSNALVLLIQANAMLNQIHQPVLYPLQEQLNKVIIQLKLIPAVSTANMLAQLAALKESIQKIPLVDGIMHNNAASNNLNTVNSPTQTWSEKLQHSLGDIKDLVIIRYHDKPFEPLMPPATQVMVQQTWVQLFNQASWAVTQQDAEVYQSSLQQAVELLQKHFSPGQTEVVNLIKEINQLKAININPQVPDLSPVLQAFMNGVNQLQLTSPTSTVKKKQENAAGAV